MPPRASPPPPTFFDVSRLLDRRRDNWLLATMLWVLHAALQVDLSGALARALMTAHLGLFFLWQPLWQRDQRLDWPAVLLILAFTASCVGTLSAWWLFAWLILLVGIVTGRARADRPERLVQMLALAFLVSELLIFAMPLLFAAARLDAIVHEIFGLALIALPALIGFVPVTAGVRQTYPIDFFRGVIVALLTALLAVGSVLLTQRQSLDYPGALFASLLAVAGFLVFISWLITPATGTGLGALWEKSVLNIGTPFEAWMASLADHAAREQAPEAFLGQAFAELVATPWVAGVHWQDTRGSHLRGTATARSTHIETEHLAVTLYLDHPLGPTLLLHCRLLIETLGYFHAAKQREQEHAHQAQLRAIHETGARLTHDIKNLLQSLRLLATAATRSPEDPASLALLQRQLPVIAQRLQGALDKLSRPAAQSGAPLEVDAWWAHTVARLGDRGVALSARIEAAAPPVPGDVLDSVLENLLDNVRLKTLGDPAVACTVELLASPSEFLLTVSDSGAPVPADLVPILFQQILPSATGFGIGLHQSAQLALRAGFTLSLATNRPGEVRFELRRDAR